MLPACKACHASLLVNIATSMTFLATNNDLDSFSFHFEKVIQKEVIHIQFSLFKGLRTILTSSTTF